MPFRSAMISVVIPTLNCEQSLAPTLAALIPAAVDGFVREVIVVDGGSTDRTLLVAENAGVDIIETSAGRGHQLRAGAKRARFPWLLFLHTGTELAPGWDQVAANFMVKVDTGRIPQSAAAFRFRLMDEGWRPRLVEQAVGLRCAILRLTCGDQGLLIPRGLYDQIGGFSEQSLMEDLDVARRLGRRRLRILAADALTSSTGEARNGWAKRPLRNEACLALYAAGFSPQRLAWMYPRAERNAAALDTRERPTLP